MKKIAIVLFNLGGPDSLEAVRPFLFNLFSDPAIIRLPGFLRNFVAKKISSKREKEAREIYSKIGGKSPILEQTKAQAKALEEKLNFINHQPSTVNYKTFISMRYWNPFAYETIEEITEYHPDEIILLPLYPQFSTTTTGSSVNEWWKLAKDKGLEIPTRTICCYPADSKFTDSHVGLIRKYYEKAANISEPRLLFSAHGLPEKIVKDGDPYQWQVERTVGEIIAKLDIPLLDLQICYQSRVGPMKWIGPSLESEIIRAASDNKPVVVVPVSFVSEHSETLVELDIEYKKLAENMGLEHYFRVPALQTDDNFITSLAEICINALERPTGTCTSSENTRICPQRCGGCIGG